MTCKCDNCGGKTLGLAHIGIMVRDIEVSKAFYVEKLGFTLYAEQAMGTTKLAFLNVGGCILELVQSANYSERAAGVIDHIAIEVEDIETLVCKLIEKGVAFETDKIGEAPNLLGGVKNIFFKGPDGERIEFFDFMKK